MVFTSNELDFLILQNGKDGVSKDSKYTWVKYSQYSDGRDLTDDSSDAIYIGIAYNKDSTEESNIPTDYKWSKIHGDNGQDGYTVILSNENVSFAAEYGTNEVACDQSYSSTISIFQGIKQRNDFTIGTIDSANGITVTKDDTKKEITLSVKTGTEILADNGSFTVPITIDGIVLSKEFTWSLTHHGAVGVDGKPAINIVVGNEVQNIPCSNDGLTLENMLIEIPFYAYEGTNRVDCTAVVGLLPEGITLGRNEASTTEKDGLIILNVAKGANLGSNDVLFGDINITFTVNELNIVKKFSWVKTKNGADGADGTMTLYSLESSALVINKNFDNTLSPASIIFSAHCKATNSIDLFPYNGRFIIEESEDGVTFNSKYISTQNESSIEYAPSSSNVKSIRSTLCEADKVSVMLDRTTVVVLSDESIKNEITKITESVSGAYSEVDKVNKKITDKVWQTDITTSINNYDGTTAKAIRDRVTLTEKDIDGITNTVSDVQTTLENKADGSTVQTLTERVAKAEQTAEGFKQTVEENYATKSEMGEEVSRVESTFDQRAGKIEQSVKDAEGNISTLTTDLSGVTQRVSDAEGRITEVETDISGFKVTVGDTYAKSYKIYFYLSTSTTELIGGTWSETPPEWEDGKYLWQKTITTKGNDKPVETPPVCISGATGQSGKGIKSTVVTYKTSSSGTTPPTGTWQSAPPSVSPGQYLWTKTLFTYTDNSTSESYSVSKAGTNGTNGTDGKSVSVSSTFVTYQTSTNGTTPPTTWVDAPNAKKGEYLWTKTVVNFTDGKSLTTYTVSYQGLNGEKGDSGVSIGSVVNYYLAYASNSGVTTGTSGWTTTIQTPTSAKPYLWNYEVVKSTSGTTISSTTPCIIGNFAKNGTNGSDGTNGTDGSDGKGITSITEYYALSTTTTAPADSSFSTTIKTMTSTNKYLWNYEVITYTTGSPTTTAKKIIGVYGNTGSKGDTGTSIVKVEVEFYRSTSKTTQTGGSWKTTPDPWAENYYMWIRNKITYKNPTSTSTTTPTLDTGWDAANQARADFKVELGKIEGRVQTAEGSISTVTQTANSVQTEVEAARGGKASLGVRVDEISADVTNAKGDIARLKIEDGKISQSVTETNQKIDNIEIGGRNLLLNTSTPTVITASANNWNYAKFKYEPEVNTEYTVSANIEITDGTFTTVKIYGCYDVCAKVVNIVNNKIVYTFQTPNTIPTPSNGLGGMLLIYPKNSGETANNGMIISKLKLEIGNKATDWTPAPEDIDKDIEDRVDSATTTITEEYKSFVEETAKEIRSSVTSIETDLDGKVSSSQVEQILTDKMVTFEKKTNQSIEDAVNGKVSTEEIKEWARFDGSELELGASNSPFKCTLTEERLSFWEGSNEVAYFSNNEMHVLKAVVTSAIGVGSLRLVDENELGFSFMLGS